MTTQCFPKLAKLALLKVLGGNRVGEPSDIKTKWKKVGWGWSIRNVAWNRQAGVMIQKKKTFGNHCSRIITVDSLILWFPCFSFSSHINKILYRLTIQSQQNVPSHTWCCKAQSIHQNTTMMWWTHTSEAKYLTMAASFTTGRPIWCFLAALHIMTRPIWICVATWAIWCCMPCWWCQTTCEMYNMAIHEEQTVIH